MKKILKLLSKLKPKNIVQIGITFNPDTFPINCISCKIITNTNSPSKFIENLPIEELISLQFSLEHVLEGMIKPAVKDRMEYDKEVKGNINQLLSEIEK